MAYELEYFLYTEPWEEDSNVNLTHIDEYIAHWLESHPTCKKIIISADTHATIRCNLFVALLDYRCRVQKILGTIAIILGSSS